MSKDITNLLNEWMYQPDEVMVRIVHGDDGRSKIQLRVDLGLLQMEMDGRPDGLRPEGYESWLEYYEHKQARTTRPIPTARPWSSSPRIAPSCGAKAFNIITAT